MSFHWIDWAVLILFFVITISVGLRYAGSAGKSVSEFFLGGRSLPWWIAGTSMVATTFAADTPLLVAGLVSKNGISGNWLWWNMLFGGMLTTFFFAKYWRRSGVMTEVELIELRYSGRPAALLRGFKAVYLGLVMNAVIIGWINLAMMKILRGFFGIPPEQAIYYIGAAMLVVAIYSAVSGLMGVAITDVIQFIIAMTGCIILAIIVLSSPRVGGIAGLKAALPDWSLSFFPAVTSSSSASEVSSVLSIGIGAFLARVGVQWWSSWYPGAEPGGGGYVAQRMMSCKDEKNAVFATLFFQIAHYCLRPWPWILVGLSAIVLYPQLGANEKELGYVLAMNEFLPVGLKGLLLAAFFAAYMSSTSTQLNWGASYLVNDLYKRFIHPTEDQKELIRVSRIVTLLLMVVTLAVTTQLHTIEGAWNFIIECGAGLGLVLILRWYWWRINAWSEITGTVAPFIAYGVSTYWFNMAFPESFFYTVAFTTVAWLLVTYLTAPEPMPVLQRFYNRIQPAGMWRPVAESLGQTVDNSQMGYLAGCWFTSVVLLYSVLFLLGKLIFMEWQFVMLYLATALLSFFALRYFMRKVGMV
jgi:solute:Na+ symporter, SSS family